MGKSINISVIYCLATLIVLSSAQWTFSSPLLNSGSRPTLFPNSFSWASSSSTTTTPQNTITSTSISTNGNKAPSLNTLSQNQPALATSQSSGDKKSTQYVAIKNFASSFEAMPVTNFITRQIGFRYKYFNITNVLKHSSNPNNFQVEADLKYSEDVKLKYIITLVKTSIQYEITKQQIINLPTFSAQKLRKIANQSSIPIINDVQKALKRSYRQKLMMFTNLLEVQAFEPYFAFTYSNRNGDKLKAIVNYDLFKDQVILIQFKDLKSSQAQIKQYEVVENFLFDFDVSPAWNYLRRSFGLRSSYIEATKVLKQAVNGGYNFQFELDLKYSQKNIVRYIVYVSQTVPRSYQIKKQQFINLTNFNVINLRKLSSPKQLAIISNIESALLKTSKEKLNRCTQLSQVEASEPYFVLTFQNPINSNDKAAVTLLYDVVKDQVNILNINLENIKSQPVVPAVTEPVNKLSVSTAPLSQTVISASKPAATLTQTFSTPIIPAQTSTKPSIPDVAATSSVITAPTPPVVTASTVTSSAPVAPKSTSTSTVITAPTSVPTVITTSSSVPTATAASTTTPTVSATSTVSPSAAATTTITSSAPVAPKSTSTSTVITAPTSVPTVITTSSSVPTATAASTTTPTVAATSTVSPSAAATTTITSSAPVAPKSTSTSTVITAPTSAPTVITTSSSVPTATAASTTTPTVAATSTTTPTVSATSTVSPSAAATTTITSSAPVAPKSTSTSTVITAPTSVPTVITTSSSVPTATAASTTTPTVAATSTTTPTVSATSTVSPSAAATTTITSSAPVAPKSTSTSTVITAPTSAPTVATNVTPADLKLTTSSLSTENMISTNPAVTVTTVKTPTAIVATTSTVNTVTPKPSDPRLTAAIVATTQTATPVITKSVAAPTETLKPAPNSDAGTSIVTTVVPKPSADSKSVVATLVTTSTAPTQTLTKSMEKISATEISATTISKSKYPTAQLSLNSDDVFKRFSDIANPNILPFLTESIADQQDSKKLESVIKFLIKTVPIADDFTVLLANQLRYAVRVVLQLKTNNKVFETLVSYVFKNGDKNLIEAHMLIWREIDSILDTDPEIFSSYYPTVPSPFLDSIIQKAFQKQQSISNYKKLLMIEQRTVSNGIYYRINIEAVSGALYEVVLFWAPETDSVEIQKYEILSNGYDLQQESRMREMPVNDKKFNAAAQLLVKSFGDILKTAQPVVIASHNHDDTYNYRMVFSGSAGRYEAIVSVDSNLNAAIIKWEKLDSGYVYLRVADFAKQDSFKELLKLAKTYVESKLHIPLEPENFAYKYVSGLDRSFRFFFKTPFPFQLTVEQKESDGKLSVRGLEKIQSVAASQFYNERLFSGYTSTSAKAFKTDPSYDFLLSSLVMAQDKITKDNSELVTAFTKRTTFGVYYRLIFRVTSTQKTYLATLFHDITTDQYQTLVMEEFERKTEKGDYRWSCKSNQAKSGECTNCESGKLLTSGRCYSQSEGCDLQVGPLCHICGKGFIKSGSVCQNNQQGKTQQPKSPQSIPVDSKQSLSTAKPIQTTQQTKSISTATTQSGKTQIVQSTASSSKSIAQSVKQSAASSNQISQFSKKNSTVTTKYPTAQLSLNSDDVFKRFSDVANPNILPFLTESIADQQDSKKLESVIKFLIKTVPIADDFTVLLANQLRYAVRVVLQLKTNNKVFETLVSYVFKNGDKNLIEAHMLIWREIDSILDTDPEIFSSYYPTVPSPFLDSIIQKAFQKQQSISNYKKLLMIEQRTVSNGIYYRINIEAVSGALYEVVLFWAPETDSVEIQKYEILSNGYDLQQESRMREMPVNDKKFNAAAQLLVKSFGDILKTAQPVVIASHNHDDTYNYRMVFSGSAGRYEAIVSVDSNLNAAIIKWEKLDSGYVYLRVADFAKQDSFKELLKLAKTYVESKLHIPLEPENFAYKYVSGLDRSFRFFFKTPFPFQLTVEQKESDGKLSVRGLEKIQSVAASQFYNERLFSGYTSTSAKAFKTDPSYDFLLSSLVMAQDKITKDNSELVTAFTKRTTFGVYYRLIFRVTSTQKTYLATLFHDITTDQYQTLVMEEFERKTEKGDYRWSCKSNQAKSGECTSCESGKLLTSGRCYSQSEGCDLQVGPLCHICGKGFIKSGSACQKLQN